MAILRSKPSAWYEVAARVVRSAFVTRESLFTPGRQLWTDANIADFERRYVGQPDEGDRDHSQKLQAQFADATPEQWQFAAELLYLHYLPFDVMIKAETKRARVREMLAHTGVTIPPDLDAALQTGVANPGPANQHRYWQIAYLAKLLGAWWRLPQAERDAAIADADAFKRICESMSMQASDTQRHALLYMAFPAVFEPIVSGNTKRRIAEQLADAEELAVADLDERLRRIRARLTPEFGDDFSFFADSVKARWSAPTDKAGEDGDTGDDETSYWRMSAGSNAEEWPRWRDEGYVAIGWLEFGDLSGVSEQEFDARQARIAQEKNDPDFVNGGSNQVYRFALEMKAGDWVVINHGFHSIIGIGQLTGDYYFKNDGEGREHRRAVRWTDLAKRPCPKKWRSSLNKIDRAMFERIVAAGPSSEPVAAPGGSAPVPKDVAYSPDEVPLDRLNTIYYGPPGTGKTRAALLAADEWVKRYGGETVEQVTFHPSYGYEDFIEGFRPDENGRFALRDGVLKRLAARASADRGRPYLLVIDEINRGDVARIFGELITLIEPDKRGRACTLPYSLKPFAIPSNLYLLGTMNTADRSVSLMDLAFRRRFSFEPFLPDATILGEGPGDGPYCTTFRDVPLAGVMRSVNASLLGLGIDADRSIGHSYFLVARSEADDEAFARLSEAFQYSILPLVEEYCFAMRGRIGEVLGAMVNAAGVAKREVFDDPDRFAEALRAIAERAKTDE